MLVYKQAVVFTLLVLVQLAAADVSDNNLCVQSQVFTLLFQLDVLLLDFFVFVKCL